MEITAKREMLFRAKKFNSNEWVYGYYWYSSELGFHYIKTLDEWNVAVNSLTLGQYTGIKDSKNSRKIYEGDIVDCSITFGGKHLPCRGVVAYDEHLGCFGTKNQAGLTPMHQHCINTRRVIGNIHDNPELMGDD